MRTYLPNTPQVSRLRPLAACLAIAFSAETFAGADPAEFSAASDHRSPQVTLAVARAHGRNAAPGSTSKTSFGGAPEHPTATLLVTNCNDDGPDSLRAAVAVANANDGSTIEFDLNQMQCSTITLTSGEIDITTPNLTLQGPGADLLAIDGGYSTGHYGRIFKHIPFVGTLTIQDLTLKDAKYLGNPAQQANGGCVYSSGTVDFIESRASGCQVLSQGAVNGGFVWARYVNVSDSTIADCRATSGTSSALGGGIVAGHGGLTAKYSTIENNVAYSYGQFASVLGGGILVSGGPSLIQFSTISGNRAKAGGGIDTFGNGATATISDSTFSGNSASNYGGLYIRTNKAYLDNVTVAFNSASGAGGIAGIGAGSLQSNSSIFAYNVTDDGTGIVESDVESDDGIVTGSKNLIIAANAGTIPPGDTISSCPRLAPLLDNGGPTHTHALLPGSPAIDAGMDNGATVDQRGSGFPRIVGASADIGAFEWSAGAGDDINMSGFDCK